MAESESIEIVSVNVARPTVLLKWPEKDVISAINKKRVASPTLQLTEINLEGDEQADTRPTQLGGQVHGGEDQAVYAYPFEHYAAFERELGHLPPFGLVGENLTTRGATESDVYIGDVWAWGDALLQVTSPRGPCYKLGIRLGRQALRRWVREGGMVGWYLRVLRPGTVPTTGTIDIVERHPARVSVLDVHQTLQDPTKVNPARLVELEPLAMKIRRMLQVANRDMTWGVPESDD